MRMMIRYTLQRIIIQRWEPEMCSAADENPIISGSSGDWQGIRIVWPHVYGSATAPSVCVRVQVLREIRQLAAVFPFAFFVASVVTEGSNSTRALAIFVGLRIACVGI